MNQRGSITLLQDKQNVSAKPGASEGSDFTYSQGRQWTEHFNKE